jgi:GNAT superfamily N-acetyltransferase
VSDTIRVRTLEAAGECEIQELSDVLIDCVEGGASVSFMLPIARSTAEAFWRSVAAAVERGERILVVAENAAGEIIGTVQIILAQVENQPHRADIAKMLVHRRARRHGVGAALLDTASGDAERLYAKLGWQRCGVIPGYALLPGGGLCDTTFFYRTL